MPNHERMVDELEAGESFDKRVRIAVQVGDLGEAAGEVATPEGGPSPPRWRPRGATATSASGRATVFS
jgi:hypothetical protein